MGLLGPGIEYALAYLHYFILVLSLYVVSSWDHSQCIAKDGDGRNISVFYVLNIIFVYTIKETCSTMAQRRIMKKRVDELPPSRIKLFLNEGLI